MPTRFSPPTTAEQVILAVDAVSVNQGAATIQYVADFTDLPTEQAEAALLLATDLGFLASSSQDEYCVESPLCRFLATRDQMQKATVLRVLLESYQPFLVFRRRLKVAATNTEAARQTKAALGLTEHHGEIGATLISLGTFSQAINTTGGGQYEITDPPLQNELEHLMRGCIDQSTAEPFIASQLGQTAHGWVSRDEVILPLSDAIQRAYGRDARGAVVQAGNAVESYLVSYAANLGISLNGTGINAKIDEIKRHDLSKMPTKISNVGKYLGHVRNAADHGIDPETGAQWRIRYATGVEYVFVACSFIAATTAISVNGTPEI